MIVRMEFEDSRTPRTLIRYILDNKLASTYPKSRQKKRIKSFPTSVEPSQQPDFERSLTPRTLIKNALKAEEVANPSVYVRQHKHFLTESIEKESTPPFKRRAVERKHFLRSSKIKSPEAIQKDSVGSESKHLDISPPKSPYLCRHSKRKQKKLTNFKQGVKRKRAFRKGLMCGLFRCFDKELAKRDDN